MKWVLSREEIFDHVASRRCGVECYRLGQPRVTVTFAIPEWLCKLLTRYKNRNLRFNADAFGIVGRSFEPAPQHIQDESDRLVANMVSGPSHGVRIENP